MISRKSAWRITSATKITNSSRRLMNESGSSTKGQYLFQSVIIMHILFGSLVWEFVNLGC